MDLMWAMFKTTVAAVIALRRSPAGVVAFGNRSREKQSFFMPLRAPDDHSESVANRVETFEKLPGQAPAQSNPLEVAFAWAKEYKVRHRKDRGS